MRIMILIRDKNQIARGNLCIQHCLLSKHSKWAGQRFALSIRRIASHTRLIRRRGRQLVKRLGGRIFSRRAETAASIRAMTVKHATIAATFRYVYPAFLILSDFILSAAIPFPQAFTFQRRGRARAKHSCPPRRSAAMPCDYCSASFLSLLYFSLACTSASPNRTFALSGNAICSAEYLVSLRMKS